MPSARHACSAALIVALALATGCGYHTEFQDDLANAREQSGPMPPRLNGPYLRGTVTNIRAIAREGSLEGWGLESSDPSVLRLASVHSGYSVDATAVAIAVGMSTVRLRDPQGNEQISAQVEVVTADRFELFAAGPVVAGRRAESVTTIRVLSLASARFGVRYFSGSREAHGVAAIELPAVAGAAVSAGTARFDELRNWIQIRPLANGVIDVPIIVDGVQLPSVRVVGVGASTLTGLRLIHADQVLPNGAPRAVYAQAFASTDPVFGAAVSWSIDGAAVAGTGDLLQYTEDNSSSDVSASFQMLQSESFEGIHARSGFVGSTTAQR